MNIQDVTTPSDLVNQNTKELTPQEHVIMGLSDMSYSDTRVVFDTILQTFIDLHVQLVQDNIENENTKGIVQMSQDLQTLWTVKKMMKGV